MLGKFFGAGLGWAFAGPIGGLIGWWLGSQLENSQQAQFTPPGGRPQTQTGDFAIAVTQGHA